MTRRPDVLFLVLDSMRTDRTSAYGHDRPTTPTFDRLATRATRYTRAYTAAPWTLPSHCSMFTGLFPTEHGVTNGFADATPRLAESATTLPERLRDAGYRTAGFSNNPWVGELSGLDRGFDEFVEWDLSIGRTTGDASIHTATDRALSVAHAVLGQAARQPVSLLKRRFFTRRLVARAGRWIEATADAEAPTFTFLNLMEAHSPYFPPAESFRALELAPPSLFESRLLNAKLLASVLGRRRLGEAERRRVMDYYDASLRFQDGQVARLLDVLDRHGLLEDTLVVVCADHGKTLGDFDRNSTPPHYAREINLRVPLLVKWPGQRDGAVAEHPFELPALHDLVLHAEEGEPARRRFTAPTSAQTSTDPVVALAQDHLPHTGRGRPDSVTGWSIVAGTEHKLVRSDDGDEYLFELADGQDRLVSEPDPDVLAALRRVLETRTRQLGDRSGGAAETRPIEPDVQSQLHDLGYR